MYETSIFIFRRSLRLYDNTGLMKALDNSKSVIPIFIFTPEQLKNNPYKSDNSVQFMMETLDDLDDQLNNRDSRMFYFYGRPHKVLKKIFNEKKIDCVYVNEDYTPYSTYRDLKIKKICEKNNVDFKSFEDLLLNPIASIFTSSGEIYEKFTPYYKKAVNYDVRKPKRNNYRNFIRYNSSLDSEYKKNKHKFYKKNKNLMVNGGRNKALEILRNIEKFKNYNVSRDCLNKHTTRLSAYIKYGCISIREAYWTFKNVLTINNDLIKQLYWRDFYYNIAYRFPHVINGKQKNFKEKYNNVPWRTIKNASNDEFKYWNAWKNANTGYPIVDASMKELNTTGYMHNRGRLITCIFLTRHLKWHWIDGEKYFANNLVDYDPVVNNGNHQWCSGSGVDSQPYFRVINPWLQSKKHDPNASYIKKWLPQFKNIPPEKIHNWYKYYKDYDINYPKPIIEHSKGRKEALDMFKKNL